MAASTHPPTAADASAPPSAAPLLWARAASLVSILPLGIWTVNHLWNNLSAFRGGAAWQQSVTEYPHPLAQLFTLIVVMLPLLMHTIWGIQRLVGARPNNAVYRNYGNLKYLLQRAAAVGVLGFLGAHIWKAYLHPHLFDGQAERFADIAGEMHNHFPTLAVYLLGTLGVAYHLANGLSTFCWTWGLVAGRDSVRRMDRVAIVFFVVLLAMSWAAIYALYNAGAALGA